MVLKKRVAKSDSTDEKAMNTNSKATESKKLKRERKLNSDGNEVCFCFYLFKSGFFFWEKKGSFIFIIFVFFKTLIFSFNIKIITFF